MKHLYILRHGQSEANAHQVVAGSQESPLSALGRKQSQLAAYNISRFFHIDMIATSPMTRATQTAEILRQELGLPSRSVVVLDNLRERDLGELEGLNYSVAPNYNGNYEDAEQAADIEPVEEVYKRAEAVLQQLQTLPSNTILIVTHNGLGRMLLTVIAHGKPFDMYGQPRLENAVIYKLADL